jgi:hypothetical protein
MSKEELQPKPDGQTPGAESSRIEGADGKPAEHLGDDTENFYQGSEPFFSFFTQAQIDLGTVRLTLEDRVVQPTSDLASQMESSRRSFLHSGDLISVMQDVMRIKSQFEQRTQSWERDAQNRGSDKRGQSGATIQRMKTEISRVRGKILITNRTLMKLEVKLHQMAGEAEDEAKRAAELEVAEAEDTTVALSENAEVTHDHSRKARVATEDDPKQPATSDPNLNRLLLQRLIDKLFGDGLPLNRQNANRAVPDDDQQREQAIDLGLPIVLVMNWTTIPPTQDDAN